METETVTMSAGDAASEYRAVEVRGFAFYGKGKSSRGTFVEARRKRDFRGFSTGVEVTVRKADGTVTVMDYRENDQVTFRREQ